MTDFDKEEFWKGLGRLYEESVRQSQTISELGGKLTGLTTVVTELAGVVKQLAGVVQSQATITQSHEGRLDRVELTVEAILEDLKRHREGLN
jgi:hypothetical protein